MEGAPNVEEEKGEEQGGKEKSEEEEENAGGKETGEVRNNMDLRTNLPNKKDVEKMMEDIQSEDPTLQLAVIPKFKFMASYVDLTREMVEAGAVPIFIKLLGSENLKIQYEALWILSQSLEDPECIREVVENGGIPAIIESLNSLKEEICELAVVALGLITNGNAANCNLVLKHGALLGVLKLACSPQISFCRAATQTLASFCSGTPCVALSQIKPAIPVLANLLICNSNRKVLMDVCLALSRISHGPDERIQAVIEHEGVAKRLVELLNVPDTKIQMPALISIGNISSGDYAQTQLLIDVGVLGGLSKLLHESEARFFHRKAIWAISNIAAGNMTQRQAVIDSGLIEHLVHIAPEITIEARYELIWAIKNLTDGGNAHIAYLVQVGCMAPLCNILNVAHGQLLLGALLAIANILRSGAKAERNLYIPKIDEVNGLDKIMALMNHPSKEANVRASRIIAYFGTDVHA